jgi:mannose-1-phosphate guanylyltransferase
MNKFIRGVVLITTFLSSAKEHAMEPWYGIILAGGSGERLWPLSRQSTPKQFLSLQEPYTLLEHTVERLSAVIAPNHLWLVLNHVHLAKIINPARFGSLLVEPTGRNTAPAILYACLQVAQKDPNAIVIFVPADAYVPRAAYTDFAIAIDTVLSFVAQHDVIGLVGIQPTYAATNYGYIEYSTASPEGLYKIKRFHEKPSARMASMYLQVPHFLWNSGMYAAKVSVFIDEYERMAPDVYQEVMAWQAGKKLYEDITPISIDYALMERSDRLWVLPAQFAWEDVGTLDAFLKVKHEMGTEKRAITAIDAHNNIVEVRSKMVALIGVDDLCIVETDDVLLVAKRSDVDKVRAVVTRLKKENNTQYL